jgi:hypothetical protein
MELIKHNEMHYHFGWLFASIGSFLLYIFAMTSLNGIAGVCAVFSGICTGGYYLTKMIRLWMNKKD